MNPDGTDVRALSVESECMSWAPDGSKIFIKSDDRRAWPWKRLATINPDGTGYTELSRQDGHRVRSLLARRHSIVLESRLSRFSPGDGIYTARARTVATSSGSRTSQGLTRATRPTARRSCSRARDRTARACLHARHGQYPPGSHHAPKGFWVVNADGTGLHLIAPHVRDTPPSWSPDGRWILFSGGADRHLRRSPRRDRASADHVGVGSGTAFAIYPSWSPDGTRFVFVGVVGLRSGGTSSRREEMAPMSSRSPTRAASTTSAQIGERTQVEKRSEDGSRARSGGMSMKSATRSSLGVTCAVALLLMACAACSSKSSHPGGTIVPSSDSPSPGSSIGAGQTSATAPTHAGAGGRIVFTSNIDPAGRWDLFTMRPDGTGVKRLTILPDPKSPFSAPDWSPDGTQLVFTSPSPSSRLGQVYRINADGSGLTQLTHGTRIDADSASWSPDGSKIVLKRAGSGEYAIWVMNADGSGLKRLTSELYDNSDPTFTPDGKHILYASQKDGYSAIWIMNADGSNQAPAHPGGAGGRQPRRLTGRVARRVRTGRRSIEARVHLHDGDRRLRDNQADRPRMLPSRRASQVLTRRQADRLSHGPQLSPPRRDGDLRDERRWHRSAPGHIEPDGGRLARLPILQWRLSGLGATPGGWVALPADD